MRRDPNERSPVILVGLDAVVPTLLEKYVLHGLLPNFKRLMELGSYTRAHSVFPGVTPINWATISTGAYPGTHGINDFGVIQPGDELNTSRNGFKAATYQAPTLWQAACESGIRSATLNFPGADSRQHPNHLWIAGRGSPASVTKYALRGLSCIATPGAAKNMLGVLVAEKRQGWHVLQLNPEYRPGSGPALEFKTAKNHTGDDGLQISSSQMTPETIFLQPGMAGAWVWFDFLIEGQKKTASAQLELTSFVPHSQDWAVVVSQITSPQDVADPSDAGEELVRELGPFTAYSGSRALDHHWADGSHMVRMGTYKGMWQARAARRLVEAMDYALVLLKWHLIDHVQHSFWGGIDPLSPFHEKVDREKYGAYILHSYQAADRMLGELLPLLDKGATLLVVSDHGHLPHLKAININNWLAKKGLITLLSGNENPPTVDWPHTSAYGSAAMGHIRVNLQNRQPHGSVPMERFESVCRQVMDALQELVDPDTHTPVIDRIFRREEAKSFGQWGERTGDVIYWMTPGYSGDFHWAPLSRDGVVFSSLVDRDYPFAEYGEGKFVANLFQSVHGAGDPSAHLGEGTEEAVLLAAGPGIRSRALVSTIPNLTCVTPTLCRATGLPLPANSEGGVLEEWLT